MAHYSIAPALGFPAPHEMYMPGTLREFCCLHGKERSLGQLVELGPGMRGLRCRPGDECKGKASDFAATDGSQQLVECALHGKKRSSMALAWENDRWQCKAGYECMASEQEPLVKVMCIVHQKTRSMDALQPAELPDTFMCKAGHRCKGGSTRASQGPYARPRAMPPARAMLATPAICCAHNKKRGIRYLDPHHSLPGAFLCKPGYECLGSPLPPQQQPPLQPWVE